MITKTQAIQETYVRIKKFSNLALSYRMNSEVTPEEKLMLAIFGESNYEVARTHPVRKYLNFKEFLLCERITESYKAILNRLENLSDDETIEKALVDSKDTAEFFRKIFEEILEYKIFVEKFESVEVESKNIKDTIESLKKSIASRLEQVKKYFNSGAPYIIIKNQIRIISEKQADLETLYSLYQKLQDLFILTETDNEE